MQLTLRNARLVDASGESHGDLVLSGETLVDNTSGAGGQELDLEGALVTPGFVDVHTHGGGGYNLHTTNPDEIREYARWAPSSGTTGFLVGVVGVPDGIPEAQLRAATEVVQTPGPGAEPLGIH
ncbi:MAG: amidohydrolase family protein, partial [Chloroflexota bacterium]|nr:amidohydrolase family protein [Chloroflexota bacterium]